MAKAKFGYQIVSEDRTQEGVKSAQAGLKNLEGSMKDINKIAATLMGAGAIAGVTMALRKLYQGASEAEQAFAKLHPETQKAKGSLEDWNRAMANLKAEGGRIVSEVMTPLRALFLDIIDPIGSATRELSAMNAELGKLGDKYTSGATKYFTSMKDAQTELTKATREHNRAQQELAETMRNRTRMQGAKPDLYAQLPGMSAGDSFAYQETKLMQWQQSMDIIDRQAEELRAIIGKTSYLMTEIPKWIKENTKAASNIPVVVAETVKRLDYSMLQNAAVGEVMASRPPAWLAGFGGAGYGQAPKGETDWFMEQRANALGAASDERNPVDTISQLMQALGVLGGTFSSVAMIMQPMQIVFQAMLDVLTPVMDSVIAPLIGALSIVGQALGQVLAPILIALSPIIEAISKGFVWLYNNIIVPIGNGIWALFTNIGNTIKWVVDKIVALGTTIWYIVSFQWGKLGSVSWGDALPQRVTAQEGPLSQIGVGDLSAAGTTYQTSQGSSASYSQARPITVNVVVNTDVITGESGGFRELAIKMQGEIEAVLALGLA